MRSSGSSVREGDLERIPVDVMFNARWWHEDYGIVFDEDFFLDPRRRVEDERKMRIALYDRFGDIGLGEKGAKPRPIVGSVFLTAKYLLPMLLGCEVVFHEDAEPEVVTSNLTAEAVMGLEIPNLARHPIWGDYVKMMDALEERFGYLTGDLSLHGVFDTALEIRGPEFLIDLLDNLALVNHLGWLITRTAVAVAFELRRRTRTSALTVSHIIEQIDPSIHVVSNGSFQGISPKVYERRLLKFDQYIVEALAPAGFQHLGRNSHLFAPSYAKANPVYMDVGYGSDPAEIRRVLPDAWLSLHLDPTKMSTCSEEQVQEDVWNLLAQVGGAYRIAIVAADLDYGTPEQNVRAIFHAVDRYRGEHSICDKQG